MLRADAKRRIAISIKTSGDDPKKGARMTEIACIELNGLEPTGKNFHFYLYPGDDNMDRCIKIYRANDKLQRGTDAVEKTILAMRHAPCFTDVDAAKITKDGVAEFMIDKMYEALEFKDIEARFMSYLMQPDTTIVTHDIGRLKKFLRNELSKENWEAYAKKFDNNKHGMMQKIHKLRPVLYPPTTGAWNKNLGFNTVCEYFKIPVAGRTEFSAMQDALLLTVLLRTRKQKKMERISLFPKSKSHPYRNGQQDAEQEVAVKQEIVRRDSDDLEPAELDAIEQLVRLKMG